MAVSIKERQGSLMVNRVNIIVFKTNQIVAFNFLSLCINNTLDLKERLSSQTIAEYILGSYQFFSRILLSQQQSIIG